MARIRSIKPEYWSDRKLAKQHSRDDRLFYIGLWNEADDEGRFIAEPRRIAGAIFPYENDIDESWVCDALQRFVSTGRLVLYEVDGEVYGQLTKFPTHQKINHPSTSRIPAPTTTCAISLRLTGDVPDGSSASRARGRSREQGAGSREVEQGSTALGASGDAPAVNGSNGQRWPQSPKRGSDGQYQYPPEFEAAWASYPKRSGSNPKLGAYSAWRSCALKGSDPDALVRAAQSYRQAMQQSGKEGTEYVQQASTFYGKKGTWVDYADAPYANGSGSLGGGSAPLSPSERRAFQSAMKNAET